MGALVVFVYSNLNPDFFIYRKKRRTVELDTHYPGYTVFLNKSFCFNKKEFRAEDKVPIRSPMGLEEVTITPASDLTLKIVWHLKYYPSIAII
jgi:hypothetical protein